MAYEAWVQLIKEVSNEQGFKVEGGDFVFSVYIDRWHGIAYQLKVNSSGYVQAHQWEAKANDEAHGVELFTPFVISVGQSCFAKFSSIVLEHQPECHNNAALQFDPLVRRHARQR